MMNEHRSIGPARQWTSIGAMLVLVLAGCARAPAASGSMPNDQSPFQIEKPAMLISGHPGPRYPEALLAAGDTGSVEIRVTVTPSGRADMKSVEVTSSSHSDFTRAALEVLPKYRFVPAEIDLLEGCTVNGPVVTCPENHRGKLIPMTVGMRFVFLLPPAPTSVTVSAPKRPAPLPPP